MLILLDNGIPRGLALFFAAHTVDEARARGWQELTNGDLIQAAEHAGFQVMVTNDKNIRHQQNLTGRRLAIVVLENSQWPMVKAAARQIAEAVDAASSGTYSEVPVPSKKK
jgi:predicted nuclease of predicted toxin-antitoxin system